MSTPIVVVVAHVDRLVSEALAVALSQSSGIQAVHHRPRGGAELSQAVREACPTVVVVGDPLADMGGPAAARVALAAQCDARVLLVAHECVPERAREALAAGAVGYLPEDLDVDGLVDAVRRAGEGEEPILDATLARLLGQEEVPVPTEEDAAARLAQLSPRQLEILRYMGAGLTAQQMGDRTGLADPTIRAHIGAVLARLGVRSQVEAVGVARKLDAVR